PGELSLLQQARATAGTTPTPTQVLDGLSARLPEHAQRGLLAFRIRLAGRGATAPTAEGDRRAMGAIEPASRTQDLVQFLTEKGLTQAERANITARLAEARAELALARMREQGAVNDPLVRASLDAHTQALVEQLRAQHVVAQDAFDQQVQAADVTELIADL